MNIIKNPIHSKMTPT